MQTVKWGKYPQTDISGKLLEPIEWVIIKEDHEKVLLLSKMILDTKPFCQEESGWVFGNAWNVSSVRKWLNDTFLQHAFSEHEKESVIPVSLDNHKGHLFQGDNTTDTVFLLSADEFESVSTEALRQVEATPFAFQNQKWVYASMLCWWLRLPTMGSNNSLVFCGWPICHLCSSTTYQGIRPALWAKKDALNRFDGL